MSLSSGLYVVTSLAGNRFISRSPVEDKSLKPKQVFALPEGSPGSLVRPLYSLTH